MAHVVALAGRRIDAPGAVVRFPLEEAPAVQGRLRALFVEDGAAALVASGACGADLLALEAAGALGMRRRVVLPFAPERFRETSVVDRPGDWGPAFDRVVDEVSRARDLVVLEGVGDGDAAYAAVSEAILDEAQNIAREGQTAGGTARARGASRDVVAVAVWDGKSRGEGDLTEHFAKLAEGRGLRVLQVLTVPGGELRR